MNKIVGQAYSGDTITLDGMHFDNCDFDDCNITFHGWSLFEITNCRFLGCRWTLAENATITAQGLSKIYRTVLPSGPKTVENVFSAIRDGSVQLADSEHSLRIGN